MKRSATVAGVVAAAVLGIAIVNIPSADVYAQSGTSAVQWKFWSWQRYLWWKQHLSAGSFFNEIPEPSTAHLSTGTSANPVQRTAYPGFFGKPEPPRSATADSKGWLSTRSAWCEGICSGHRTVNATLHPIA